MTGRVDLCDVPPAELSAKLEELQNLTKKQEERVALQQRCATMLPIIMTTQFSRR